jgi:hypothetical protein
MRNDFKRKVLDKLFEVAHDIRHRDIEGLLQFSEPLFARHFFMREEVLALSETLKAVMIRHREAR